MVVFGFNVPLYVQCYMHSVMSEQDRNLHAPHDICRIIFSYLSRTSDEHMDFVAVGPHLVEFYLKSTSGRSRRSISSQKTKFVEHLLIEKYKSGLLNEINFITAERKISIKDAVIVFMNKYNICLDKVSPEAVEQHYKREKTRQKSGLELAPDLEIARVLHYKKVVEGKQFSFYEKLLKNLRL